MDSALTRFVTARATHERVCERGTWRLQLVQARTVVHDEVGKRLGHAIRPLTHSARTALERHGGGARRAEELRVE